MSTMTEKNAHKKILATFGFCFGKNSVHTARTLMLGELELLLSVVTTPFATRDEYIKAIVDQNCLGKRSVKSRALTSRHLTELYALDPSMTVFRNLHFFWIRDVLGHPLLALLCAYVRDPLLRMSASFILKLSPGEQAIRENLEDLITAQNPDRFSPNTRRSVAQNINSTWTQSGHLTGKTKKIRTKVCVSPGAVSFALFLGYLSGSRGMGLFETEYVKILDCSVEQAVDLAEDASMKGWIVFKRIGRTMELLFPNLLTEKEAVWIHEQN